LTINHIFNCPFTSYGFLHATILFITFCTEYFGLKLLKSSYFYSILFSLIFLAFFSLISEIYQKDNEYKLSYE